MAKKKSSSSHNGEIGRGKDCCQICGRILLFLVAVVSVIFSLLVIGTCDFIEFLVEVPDQNGTTSLTAFSFGQFRYDVNNTGCKSIDDADLPIDWTIWTGRCSTAAAGVCATLACILIVVEFLCCRFNFSRCLLSTLFAIGILGMACAFFMFTSSICRSADKADTRYPCQAGTGAWYACVCIGLYFASSLTACFAPRPKPMAQRLREDENDPCVCCGGKKKDDEKKQKEDEPASSKKQQTDEEQPPVPVPAPPPPPPPPPPPAEPAQHSQNQPAQPEPAPRVQEEATQTAAPAVAAAAVVAAPVVAAAATQTSPPRQSSIRIPVQQVVTNDTHDDNVSQVSSGIHPSGVSAVTLPTFRDVSIYGSDLFFDATGDANSV